MPNTTTTKAGQLDRRLRVLLREYDFVVRGKQIWKCGIGYMPERPFMPCRDVFDAAERLIPIIHDDDYHRRHNQIIDTP